MDSGIGSDYKSAPTQVNPWQDFLNAHTAWVTIFNGVIWMVIIGLVLKLFIKKPLK